MGVCGSSGSALHRPAPWIPSHVLLAIGLPHEIAHGSLRLTLSETNTEGGDGLRGGEHQTESWRDLRAMSPLYDGLHAEARRSTVENDRDRRVRYMYSEKVMDHFQNPSNVGEIENASGIGTVGNAKCGDIMKMDIRWRTTIITRREVQDLRLRRGRCHQQHGHGDGQGQDASQEAMQVTNKAVAEALGGLPPVKLRLLPLLAEQALARGRGGNSTARTTPRRLRPRGPARRRTASSPRGVHRAGTGGKVVHGNLEGIRQSMLDELDHALSSVAARARPIHAAGLASKSLRLFSVHEP